MQELDINSDRLVGTGWCGRFPLTYTFEKRFSKKTLLHDGANRWARVPGSCRDDRRMASLAVTKDASSIRMAVTVRQIEIIANMHHYLECSCYTS